MLGQAYPNVELIIIDDGSTDKTPAHIETRQAQGDPIRYVYQPNAGQATARANGAALAHGAFIVFLDADDWLMPNALQAHIDAITESPTHALTIGGSQHVDETGRVCADTRKWDRPTPDVQSWLYDVPGVNSCLMFRRTAYETVGGFDKTLRAAEEMDISLRLGMAGFTMCWTPAYVAYKLMRPGSVSDNHERIHDFTMQVLEQFFAAPNVPADLRTQRAASIAEWKWTMAASAFAAHDFETGQRWVREALALDVQRGDQQVALHTRLFSALPPDAPQRDRWVRQVASALPEQIRPNSQELRALLAEPYMRQFFALNRTNPKAANRHLRAGIKHDWRWLFNHGVLRHMTTWWRY